MIWNAIALIITSLQREYSVIRREDLWDYGTKTCQPYSKLKSKKSCDPHSVNTITEAHDWRIPNLTSSAVHAWVVTEWALLALNTPQGTSKRWLKRTLKARCFHLNICRKNSIQILNLHGPFVDFYYVLQMICLDSSSKNDLVSGPSPFRDIYMNKPNVQNKALYYIYWRPPWQFVQRFKEIYI